MAIAERDGPAAGLAALDAIDGLGDHFPYAAGRAELLARQGNLNDARAAYREALRLPTNEGTRGNLAARRAELH